MDDEMNPIPINIDLAEDHYDHQETPPEPVHSEPEDGDPPTTGTKPKAVKAADE